MHFFSLLMKQQPERERPQPWQINVHAKAKSFDFKFQLTTISPPWKFPRFPINLSLKLNLFPSLFQPNKPDPHFPIPRKTKSMKSKFLRLLGKLRPRPSNNKPSSNRGHPHPQFPVNHPTHFAFEEPITRRRRDVMVVVIVAVVCFAIGVHLSIIFKICGGCVWEICVELCSFFGQVIRSSFSPYLGGQRGDNYVSY